MYWFIASLEEHPKAWNAETQEWVGYHSKCLRTHYSDMQEANAEAMRLMDAYPDKADGIVLTQA